MSEGAGWGRGLMALFGWPKRAIKPRPQPAVPNGTPANLFHLLILVNNLSAADGIFDFPV